MSSGAPKYFEPNLGITTMKSNRRIVANRQIAPSIIRVVAIALPIEV